MTNSPTSPRGTTWKGLSRRRDNPSHVVKLATQAVDEARRRVQQAITDIVAAQATRSTASFDPKSPPAR